MVGPVSETEGVAGLELDQTVVALRSGVGDPGGQIGLDRVPPLLEGLGQGGEFGQVGMVGDVGQEAVAGRADRGAVRGHSGTAHRQTQQVAQELQQAGFNADWLNGDLPQNEREKVLERTRKGTLRYLVATDVAARGIDISHLTHVINYDFPVNIEGYIHRTGRTGRAGRTEGGTESGRESTRARAEREASTAAGLRDTQASRERAGMSAATTSMIESA